MKTNGSVNQQLTGQEKTIAELQGSVADLEKQLSSVTKENRNMKKTIYAFQLWSKVPGANGQATANLVSTANYCRCKYCEKVFSAEFYLDSHLDRRHCDKPNYIKEKENVVVYTRTHQPQQDQKQPQINQEEWLKKVNEVIEKFGDKLQQTDKQLRHELEERLSQELQKKEASLQDALLQNRMSRDKELQDIKTIMTRQLEEERKLLHEERRAFEDLYRDQIKRSNIGSLESDGDDLITSASVKENDILHRLEERYDTAFEKLQVVLEKQIGEIKKVAVVQQPQQDPRLLDDLLNTRQKVQLLEDLLKQQSAKKTSSSDLAPKDKDQWGLYLKTLNSFKYAPLSQCPEIKSARYHNENQVLDKRNQIQSQFDSEFKTKTAGKSFLTYLSKERYQIEKIREPYHGRLRSRLEEELDSIVTAHANQQKNHNEQKPTKLETFMNSYESPKSPAKSSTDASVNWDADEVGSLSTMTDSDDLSSIQGLDEISQANAAQKSYFDPKAMFGDAFRSYSNTPSEMKQKMSQRDNGLDPVLKTAIGHVQDPVSRRDPLEKRRNSVDDYPVSEESESNESLSASFMEPNSREIVPPQ